MQEIFQPDNGIYRVDLERHRCRGSVQEHTLISSLLESLRSAPAGKEPVRRSTTAGHHRVGDGLGIAEKVLQFVVHQLQPRQRCEQPTKQAERQLYVPSKNPTRNSLRVVRSCSAGPPANLRRGRTFRNVALTLERFVRARCWSSTRSPDKVRCSTPCSCGKLVHGNNAAAIAPDQQNHPTAIRTAPASPSPPFPQPWRQDSRPCSLLNHHGCVFVPGGAHHHKIHTGRAR